jgi:hypothetical protein
MPTEPDAAINPEHFDNYLTKLQTICTDNLGEEANNKSPPVYDSVKTALQGLNPLSTRI